MKTTSTPIKTHKALLKDEEAKDVDVHLYRSMIRSLMYLTASRPDIMFAVCACTRLQAKHIEYMVGDEVVHKELGDIMERAATTASSIEAEKDNENEEMEITATIDGRVNTITKASIRRHLKLEDSDGIPTLPNAEIFEQLALMIYASHYDKLTFQKGHFSPQWRFFIHIILHCLSPKNIAWEQFSSNIATTIIFLAINRTFNFSKMIFEGMLKNLDSRSKFLMYPRFIQIFLNKRKRYLIPHKRTYVAPTLTQKLFSNIRRVSKGYTGVKTSKSRRRAKVIIFDNEEDLEDSYKQGMIIAEIDQNPSISLVQDEGTSWIQKDAKTQGRTSADTEILLEQEEPTELVKDPSSGEKGEKEISTAEVLVSTASAIPKVSTTIPERQVYIRRSAEKRKDKGKAIMKDDESV
ncbi:hypothetical protein Tco_1227673 [Tanacetum coccineum]